MERPAKAYQKDRPTWTDYFTPITRVFFKRILDLPTAYHYCRHLMTGGLPFRQWVNLYGLNDPMERIADLGAGPCDILRYVCGERLPSFYLAVDVDDRYLDAAKRRIGQLNLNADF